MVWYEQHVRASITFCLLCKEGKIQAQRIRASPCAVISDVLKQGLKKKILLAEASWVLGWAITVLYIKAHFKALGYLGGTFAVIRWHLICAELDTLPFSTILLD